MTDSAVDFLVLRRCYREGDKEEIGIMLYNSQYAKHVQTPSSSSPVLSVSENKSDLNTVEFRDLETSIFSKLPLTQTEVPFPFFVNLYHFTLDFFEIPDFWNQFFFSLTG